MTIKGFFNCKKFKTASFSYIAKSFLLPNLRHLDYIPWIYMCLMNQQNFIIMKLVLNENKFYYSRVKKYSDTSSTFTNKNLSFAKKCYFIFSSYSKHIETLQKQCSALLSSAPHSRSHNNIFKQSVCIRHRYRMDVFWLTRKSRRKN